MRYSCVAFASGNFSLCARNAASSIPASAIALLSFSSPYDLLPLMKLAICASDVRVRRVVSHARSVALRASFLADDDDDEASASTATVANGANATASSTASSSARFAP